MFPLHDNVRSRSVPIVSWLIIAANFLVFFYELSLSPHELDLFMSQYGLVPANLTAAPHTWLPLITHMFIHAGWLHILSNMWMFFIFSDNVEDRLGSWRFLFFYFVGGIFAGLLQTFFSLGSNEPLVGASGAIAAVLGAYFLFYPRARILTFVPVFILPWIIPIPAAVFLGLWFASQFFSGVLALATPGGQAAGGIAWWAHVGGFLFGLIAGRLLTLGKSRPVWRDGEYSPW